jgi:hypothetical protein
MEFAVFIAKSFLQKGNRKQEDGMRQQADVKRLCRNPAHNCSQKIPLHWPDSSLNDQLVTAGQAQSTQIPERSYLPVQFPDFIKF